MMRIGRHRTAIKGEQLNPHFFDAKYKFGVVDGVGEPITDEKIQAYTKKERLAVLKAMDFWYEKTNYNSGLNRLQEVENIMFGKFANTIPLPFPNL